MKPTILILDDQTQYLRSLERALRGEFDVLLAANQEVATEMLSDDVALVLTDIRLDESDDSDRQGLAFIRFVRACHPTLPVVAMSALDAADIETAALSAGATKFIRKPIIVSQLKLLLQELAGLSSDNNRKAKAGS